MCLTTPTSTVTAVTSLDVELTSHEIIKPSSPTPEHLRSCRLCITDQLAPDIYVQALLFFPADGTPAAAKAAILKDSLSRTLTHFYPLAGRLSLDLQHELAHIECNDAGAQFYVAAAKARLGDLLRRPPMKELYKLMPGGGANIKDDTPVLSVQLNEFACGGVALGVCVWHQGADAASLALFLNSWGEMARGEHLPSSLPRFDSAAVLPPVNLRQPLVPAKVEGMLPKRFVIAGPDLERLRKASAFGRTRSPTRVEAVAVLVWRSIRRIREADGGARTNTPVALIPVNLRKRMPGELSDPSFGNLIMYATVVDDAAEKGAGSDRQAHLEEAMKEMIKMVDGDYARGQLEAFHAGDNMMEDGGLDIVEFSSWCRISVYRTDFGWGEPAWYCSPMRDLVNFVVLADTRDGNGVEVWVWLPEPEMEALLMDPELLEFVDPLSFCL